MKPWVEFLALTSQDLISPNSAKIPLNYSFVKFSGKLLTNKFVNLATSVEALESFPL
jgi:hypothetical protein